ncbi:MAG: hypothetical protein M3299_17305 [Thermoproteota archaeon]|nr:hypothetical protein [Thermoproteota archaeon]
MTILQDKGYIVGTIAACSKGVAACCNGRATLVRILPPISDNERAKEKNGPDVIRTHDPRFSILFYR